MKYKNDIDEIEIHDLSKGYIPLKGEMIKD